MSASKSRPLESDAAVPAQEINIELPQAHQDAVEALPSDLVRRQFRMFDEQEAARVNHEKRIQMEVLLRMERFGC